MMRRPTMATALCEALAKLLVGCVVFAAIMSTILVPLPAGAALYGPNWGASVGCAASALLQGALIGLSHRFPGVPGAPLVRLICGYLIAMMVVFAPIGASIELIADRATATWTGMGIGVVILGFGYLAKTPLPTLTRSRR